MSRRDEVAGLLRDVRLALDDDDIADRLGMNRHYVNAVCRQLDDAGFTTRFKGSDGKFVNLWNDRLVMPEPRVEPTTAPPAKRPRRKREERARLNVEALVADFSSFVRRFEQSNAFPGPSLYFHERAIERRRRHSTAANLLADERFLEYVYAVLPAWGMHRMGKQAAKVGDFDAMVESFRSCAPVIEELWGLHISQVPEAATDDVAAQILERPRRAAGEHLGDPDRRRIEGAAPRTAGPRAADRPAALSAPETFRQRGGQGTGTPYRVYQLDGRPTPSSRASPPC